MCLGENVTFPSLIKILKNTQTSEAGNSKCEPGVEKGFNVSGLRIYAVADYIPTAKLYI